MDDSKIYLDKWLVATPKRLIKKNNLLHQIDSTMVSIGEDEKYTVLSRNSTLFLFDNTNSKNSTPYKAIAGSKIDSTKISKDSTLLFAGTSTGKIGIWSTSERKKLIEYELSYAGNTENIEKKQIGSY